MYYIVVSVTLSDECHRYYYVISDRCKARQISIQA